MKNECYLHYLSTNWCLSFDNVTQALSLPGLEPVLWRFCVSNLFLFHWLLLHSHWMHYSQYAMAPHRKSSSLPTKPLSETHDKLTNCRWALWWVLPHRWGPDYGETQTNQYTNYIQMRDAVIEWIVALWLINWEVNVISMCFKNCGDPKKLFYTCVDFCLCRA